MKDKFIFSKNFKEAADKLPDDLRLQFYDALTNYALNGIEPDDVIISALLSAIKPLITDEIVTWGGARNGAGRKSKINQDEIKFNQDELEKLEKNQKEKEKKTPLNPEKNKNNIYNPPTSSNDFVAPLLPENSPTVDDSGMYDLEELILMQDEQRSGGLSAEALPPEQRSLV